MKTSDEAVINRIGPRMLVYPDMKHKPTRDWVLGKKPTKRP